MRDLTCQRRGKWLEFYCADRVVGYLAHWYAPRVYLFDTTEQKTYLWEAPPWLYQGWEEIPANVIAEQFLEQPDLPPWGRDLLERVQW